MNSNKISTASINDVPELMALINSAFRGDDSKRGWTTEAFLIEGDERIDESSLRQMMENPLSTIIKYTNEAGQTAACVYLEMQDDELYLGMLTVSPDIQGQGIGKEMLSYAEDYAAKRNCSAVVMVVISLRKELIAWYVRHGYYLTGETRPFPTENRFGRPIRDLEFVVLKKTIN